jgi:hypothetical protein
MEMTEMVGWALLGFVLGLGLFLVLEELKRGHDRRKAEREWIEARKQSRYRQQP